MIETWQIILAIIIVGLSIVMPIYYSRQRKNKTQQEEAIERMQIRDYGRKINNETRAKRDKLN
jgi:protein involved in sex pheromone biosynthesis